LKNPNFIHIDPEEIRQKTRSNLLEQLKSEIRDLHA